ncbi:MULTISPECIES: RNA polymerase factor sigma-54 [Aeromonas]|jgi:RNA polymerase sigma-54 factor|uniref:RNA polymerase sigma-54 factor n=1 Tax=Aeromonas encheleia TaxID=73010 RepID=A0AAE9SBY4_9GAMM|nr:MULTISPECIES: RNA polymerase factor sigma-54 [Aeromonas]MBV7415500.1 RNA polymerase factor sigma-54 [Aeromonas sp. sif2433]MBV7437768.1 RNA polymerase factor sigma-54 [Aeromonas sp. sif2416]MBV7598687.1 RNA polymerase factor sigma-54 [Aeromonas sp. sia0103]UNP88816.1 RNA polymerase factor sigma-54 [Aeromonas encheleia]USV57275.1 RNA polymerase factor sigma-54 [Aeromonas encheleia]
MKPTLQLRLGQSLTMTPQLQQAIRLLQLSTLELQQEIQQALDNNPLLEQEESETQETNPEEAVDASQLDSSDAMAQDKMPDELPVDTTWDDVYSAGTAQSAGPIHDGEDSVYQGETTESLQDYLLWQMRLTPFSDLDAAIALAIIDAIDESGYLTVSLEDIQAAVSSDEVEVELDEVEAVLKRVQHFDPIGIAARSVQECLLIQLAQYSPDLPWLNEAREVINEHMDLLGNRDYRTLARKTKLKESDLKEVLDLIQQLEPRPGNGIIQNESQYVIPDVSVVKKGYKWVVELNPDSAPRIRVNETYAAMARQAKTSQDSQFIRSHLQEAKWFIKSLESRNDTLLKVASCIVEQQQGFFEYGEEAMKPMVLNDIAEAVEMHESTISRVTTQKYMHTPRGIFELKFFFSSHVNTEGGGECSSTAIRALIKKLVTAENPAKPLSDSKIADLLAEQGIMVARRTIAKYRESLLIPPSNQRKRLV